MNILVTGSAGFLGRHLVAGLVAAGHSCTGVDTQHYPDHRLAHLHLHDLTEPLRLTLADFDHVVHLAGLTGRLACWQDPARATALNVGASWQLASDCAAAGVPLLYASSSEVYGRTYERSGMLTEAAPPKPVSLYGWTKLWGEQAVVHHAPPLATVARLAMPYGPGHPPGPGRAAITNWLWAAYRDDPLVVHEGARSWCYVADTVQALRLIIEQRAMIELSRGRRGGVGPWLVHVGRDDDLRSNIEVANLACAIVDNGLIDQVDPARVRFFPRPAEVAETKRLSATTLRLLTTWRPQVPLEDGMRATAEWLRRQAEIGKL